MYGYTGNHRLKLVDSRTRLSDFTDRPTEILCDGTIQITPRTKKKKKP